MHRGKSMANTYLNWKKPFIKNKFQKNKTLMPYTIEKSLDGLKTEPSMYPVMLEYFAVLPPGVTCHLWSERDP